MSIDCENNHMYLQDYKIYYLNCITKLNSLSGTHTSVQSGCRHRRNVAAQGCGVPIWHWCFVRRVSSWASILLVTPYHTHIPMRAVNPQSWARRPISGHQHGPWDCTVSRPRGGPSIPDVEHQDAWHASSGWNTNEWGSIRNWPRRFETEGANGENAYGGLKLRL